MNENNPWTEATLHQPGRPGSLTGAQVFEGVRIVLDDLEKEGPGGTTAYELATVMECLGLCVETLIVARNVLRRKKGLPDIPLG